MSENVVFASHLKKGKKRDKIHCSLTGHTNGCCELGLPFRS